MKEIEINNIVNELKEIAKQNTSTFVNPAISINPNNFLFSWLIENSENNEFTKSIKIDSINTAIDIIHLFSNNNKNEIKEGLLKNSKFDIDKPLYLQFGKRL